jgi:hypothetical protein
MTQLTTCMYRTWVPKGEAPDAAIFGHQRPQAAPLD